MWTNGQLKAARTSSAKQFWYKKCNRKAVQQVLFTVHCKLVP